MPRKKAPVSDETRARMSKACAKNWRSQAYRDKIHQIRLDDNSPEMGLVQYVIEYLSKVKSPRNIVMADIIRSYIKKRRLDDSKMAKLRTVSTHIRVSLEIRMYISHAALNSLDRRIKYLTPTDIFPLPHQKRKIKELIIIVREDVRIRRETYCGRVLQYPRV